MGFISPIESLEQPRQISRSNANTGISDRDNRLMTFNTTGQRDAAVRPVIANRIIKQDQPELSQLIGIARHPEVWLQFGFNGQTLRLGPAAYLLNQPLQLFSQCHWLMTCLDCARIQARQQKQLFQQARHSVNFAERVIH